MQWAQRDRARRSHKRLYQAESSEKKKLCQKYFDTALLNNYTKLSQVSLERFAVYTCLKTADRFFLNLTYTLTSKTKLLAYFF